MLIEIVAPADLSPEDAAAWRRLQASDARLASPYLSPDWALACAAAGGPDARGAQIVVVRQRGEPVAFLAVRVAHGRARPVGAPMCDYQGLVARPDIAVDPRAIVRALGVKRLDFTHMLADQAAFTPFMKGGGQSQVVDISGGYDAYAASQRDGGSGILKDTAKKLRKLEREVGPIEFSAMSADADAFDRLIELKRIQYRATRQTDIFEAGWTLALLEGLFARRDPAFGGALFTLKAGGQPAAYHFALRHGPVLHAWFIAHDHAFDRYSPGVALIDQMLRWGAANGVTELDLGPGDYRFKFQLANRTRAVAHGFVGAASPATLLRGAQYAVRSLAESLPLGRVSALPGKAMRRLDVITGLRA